MSNRSSSNRLWPAAALLMASAAAGQTTLHVNGGCGDDSWTGLSAECGAPDGPKATIQGGLDAAGSGDTVLVAPGLYRGAGNKNLVFGGRSIVLRSESGAVGCVIDCEDDGRGFYFQADLAAAIMVEGFTVVHGGVDDTYPGGRKGGAVYAVRSSPTLINCVFDDNRGHTGGAVFCGLNSAVTLVNCRLTNHVGIDEGSESDIHVGAGLMARDGAVVTMVGCTIADNACARPGRDHVGGGVLVRDGTAILINCVLWGNVAVDGDQLAVLDGGTLTVERCVVEGGKAEVLVENSVLNWGIDNVDADPLFIDADGLDYGLGAGSPAIDAGSNASVPADEWDLDGDGDTGEPVPLDAARAPRFVDDPAVEDTGDAGGTGLPVIDIGAYERRACRADFNEDGRVDTQDVLAFLNAWAAGDTSADFNGDGVLNTQDVLAFLNAWAGGC